MVTCVSVRRTLSQRVMRLAKATMADRVADVAPFEGIAVPPASVEVVLDGQIAIPSRMRGFVGSGHTSLVSDDMTGGDSVMLYREINLLIGELVLVNVRAGNVKVMLWVTVTWTVLIRGVDAKSVRLHV